MTKDTWDLWLEDFEDGDELVVISEDDKFHGGKARATESGLYLTRPGVKELFVSWDDIRFVADSGFPVRELRGADGHPSIEKLKPMKGLRRLLAIDSGIKRVVFGDPFLIEAATAILYNVGNAGADFWNDGLRFREVETLSLRADDGAKAQLFGLDTVYFGEVARKAKAGMVTEVRKGMGVDVWTASGERRSNRAGHPG